MKGFQQCYMLFTDLICLSWFSSLICRVSYCSCMANTLQWESHQVQVIVSIQYHSMVYLQMARAWGHQYFHWWWRPFLWRQYHSLWGSSSEHPLTTKVRYEGYLSSVQISCSLSLPLCIPALPASILLAMINSSFFLSLPPGTTYHCKQPLILCDNSNFFPTKSSYNSQETSRC